MSIADEAERARRIRLAITREAQRAAEVALAGVQGMPTALAQEMMEQVLPGLVQQFGQVEAAAALEWYAETRGRYVPGVMPATAAAEVDPARLAASARYTVQSMGSEQGWPTTLARANGMIHRHLHIVEARTVGECIRRDPKRPRFARVPRGGKTCAWCLIMASRGFAYYSKESAGAVEKWHDHCDCEIVPAWGKVKELGYPLGEYRAMYQGARDSVGNADIRDVAAELRSLYPDRVRDGHAQEASAPDGSGR